MKSISDTIEQFILSMLDDSSNSINFQRNKLAEYFGCVPSQINYVLTTRFTVEKGYYVKSKKGGGGYVTIKKVTIDSEDYLYNLITEQLGNQLSKTQAKHIVEALLSNDYINSREATIILSAVSDFSLPLQIEYKDIIRASILKQVLLDLMRIKEGLL